MLGLLILLVVIGIFVYSAKQGDESSLLGTQFNTVVTFQDESYADIRSYELFRKVAKWEKTGQLSFKGRITIPKAELVQLIHTELDIPTDQFKVTFFSTDTTKFDYIVTFTNIPRPLIEEQPILEILGIWENYGKSSYRISATLSEENFRELIAQELSIPEDSFTIHNAASFVWSRLM